MLRGTLRGNRAVVHTPSEIKCGEMKLEQITETERITKIEQKPHPQQSKHMRKTHWKTDTRPGTMMN